LEGEGEGDARVMEYINAHWMQSRWCVRRVLRSLD
jgi:hypothetical protein